MDKRSPLKKFFKALLLLVILAGVVYGLQYYYHILNAPLKYIHHYLATANKIVYKDMFWGISTGTLLFISILIILPILMQNINTRSYFKNLFQGIVTAFIFFISQSIYYYVEKISKFYLLLALIGLAIVTLILIRIVVGMYRKQEDRVEFRTAYVASITAGLIFSVLLQLITLWSNWAKANFHIKLPF